MKSFFLNTFLITTFLFSSLSHQVMAQVTAQDLQGAWRITVQDPTHGEVNIVHMFVGDYMTATSYSIQNKTFIDMEGGPWYLDGNNININFRFNSKGSIENSVSETKLIRLEGNNLWYDDQKTPMQRIDNASLSELSGIYQRIQYKDQNGMVVNEEGQDILQVRMHTERRFQMFRFNNSTGEFLGTVGGIYTASFGKMTITFEFSSVNSRVVSTSLQFDYKFENGNLLLNNDTDPNEIFNEVWKPARK